MHPTQLTEAQGLGIPWLAVEYNPTMQMGN